jgi:hypothetical protein
VKEEETKRFGSHGLFLEMGFKLRPGPLGLYLTLGFFSLLFSFFPSLTTHPFAAYSLEGKTIIAVNVNER